MRTYSIEWDLSETDDWSEDEKTFICDLPTEVDIPDSINPDEITDWLSDEYGWCVESLTLITE